MNNDQIGYLNTHEVIEESKATTPTRAMTLIHRGLNRRHFSGEDSVRATLGYSEGFKAPKPDYFVMQLHDGERIRVAPRQYDRSQELRWYWFPGGGMLDRERHCASLPEALLTAWAYYRLID